jgi:hypothetical protein
MTGLVQLLEFAGFRQAINQADRLDRWHRQAHLTGADPAPYLKSGRANVRSNGSGAVASLSTSFLARPIVSDGSWGGCGRHDGARCSVLPDCVDLD